ncbi:MAG: prolyl oligopeptidase family serine peptidase [Planctomycetota bacterium]|jgi:poly(3-hydroxybutyrate) depolymerase
MKKLALSSIALILLLAQSSTVAAPTATTAGDKVLAGLVKELVDIGDYANRNGFPVAAKAYLDDALVLAPEDKKAVRIAGKLKSEADATDEKAIKKFNKRAGKAHKKIAVGYLNLFKEYIPDKDTATVNAFLARAFHYDIEAANDYVDREAKAAFSAKDYTTTQRLLDVAAPVAGELEEKTLKKRREMMIKCEAVLSQKAPLQKTATTHTIQYLLTLPPKWSSEKKWPVVFACEGAGCGWKGANNSGRKHAKGEFIVVTPITFSNTNALVAKKYPYPQEVLDEWNSKRIEFDEPGILAIIKDLQEIYHGQDKVCITGFSGGGIATWMMVFKHPELLHCAAPGSGNFAGVSDVSDHEARNKLPVRAFQGDKDKHLAALNAQWENAKRVAEENGYENVTRELVPGGHINCHKNAFEEFRKVLGLD